ncbi:MULTISPECIES: YbdD/YjiX family protein [unclassified Streptomyces]|uniref:YbdD/YjiX family protein n=1 Tax=unclassified Streptomyces TaxID=2593676 RepID=UPI0033B49123
MRVAWGLSVAWAVNWVRGVRWYLRELTGEAEYDRYCERHRRHHPLAPIPTRRAYQVLRSLHREENPQSRCC